ncbi:hypothetical protein GYMLUDRAFT_155051, partial [Collybiopsis luxurians FD-317 M1]
MNQRNIGILVVGEAHLDQERKAEIERVHGANIKIFYSKPNNTSNAAGVAFVLNKNITSTTGAKVHEVVPGHALLLESDWHNNESISILGVYAPNISMQANAAFWTRVKTFFERNPRIRKPDIMIGDCNVVEEPMDRLPMRSDSLAAVDSLDDLKTLLQLEDGWRNTNPTSLKYTFSRKGNDGITRHARLDRIYNKTSIQDHLFEWKIETPGIKTDHEMVSVRFTSITAPHIGRGRWVLPQHILYDKQLKDWINIEGKKLEEELDALENNASRTAEKNPQLMWMDFQKNLVKKARERAKIVIPRLDRDIQTIEGHIDTISNDPELNDDERSLSTTLLKE